MDPTRDPFEELAAEFTELCRRGELPSIEAYVRAHPGYEDDIRELFPLIQQIELVRSSSLTTPTHVPTSPAPEKIGDFQIIRELGRGGMGIVYEAEQESLGRRVAIKVLMQHHLSNTTRRERFEREARTAAGLHHTNIVPIFGIGQEDGSEYFVMQYIRGVGLDQIFRTLQQKTGSPCQLARELYQDPESPEEDRTGASLRPEQQYWEEIARLIAQAADALSYAHDLGVMHRDIKPGNLLLDTDGTLWIADFGLARAIEHEDLTQEGDIVGTLRYMAPEQFDGQADAQSDIYSLGITLYEMAVRQPAFELKTGARGIRAILDKPLEPPRSKCPEIPRDLDTIIQKATAKEAKQRYASAGELKDDLLRFVGGVPVLARRVPAPERLLFWAKRNPALAASVAMTLFLLMSISAVSTGAYFHVRQANMQTQTALEDVTHEREKAQATADLAVEAFDTIFDEFAPDPVSSAVEFSLDDFGEDYSMSISEPSILSTESARFLQHMLSFYNRLAQQEGGESELAVKVADAQCRVGEIQERLGQLDGAMAAYLEAIRRYELLLGKNDNTRLQMKLARANVNLGRVHISRDNQPEAMERFQMAALLFPDPQRVSELDETTAFELARILFMLARPLPGGHPVETPGPVARKMHQSDQHRDFLPRHPGPGKRQQGRPPRQGEPRPPHPQRPDGPRYDLRQPEKREPAPFQPQFEVPEFARDFLDDAIRILERLRESNPDTPAYDHLLAKCLLSMDSHRRGPLRHLDNDHLDHAIEILENLSQAFPKEYQYRFDLAEAYSLKPAGPGQLQLMEKSATMMTELMKERPGVPEYPFALGFLKMRLSHVYQREGDFRNATESLTQAVELLDTLSKNYPDVLAYTLGAALAETGLANELMDRQELEEAKVVMRRVVNRLEPFAEMDPPKPHVRTVLGRSLKRLAQIYRRLEDHEMAKETNRRARDYIEEHPVPQ